jgi:hypothetical protein
MPVCGVPPAARPAPPAPRAPAPPGSDPISLDPEGLGSCSRRGKRWRAAPGRGSVTAAARPRQGVLYGPSLPFRGRRAARWSPHLPRPPSLSDSDITAPATPALPTPAPAPPTRNHRPPPPPPSRQIMWNTKMRGKGKKVNREFGACRDAQWGRRWARATGRGGAWRGPPPPSALHASAPSPLLVHCHGSLTSHMNAPLHPYPRRTPFPTSQPPTLRPPTPRPTPTPDPRLSVLLHARGGLHRDPLDARRRHRGP